MAPRRRWWQAPRGGEIHELTDGLGAMVVLDCVGSDQTMSLAAAAARAGGAVQVIGLGGGSLPLTVGVLPFDCSLTMPYWGSLESWPR